jgi:hypothetical protein
MSHERRSTNRFPSHSTLQYFVQREPKLKADYLAAVEICAYVLVAEYRSEGRL